MRADRLVATLLLLQARGRVTAAEVAGELEVSERTARRDLEALSSAGIPVYAQQGRGGGWSLLGGSRTDLSGLSAGEARTLFTVAGPAANATPELKAALRKLVRALPENFRAGAEAAAASVVVDPAAWGRESHRERPPHLAALQQATVDGVQVRLGYSGRGAAPSERTVHPLGLVTKGSVWYLVAGTPQGRRTFRVSRVTAVVPTGEPVQRPADFDLAQAWEHIVAGVEELRVPVQLSVLVEPWALDILRWVFGTSLQVGESADDGRLQVRIGGERVEVLAAQVAGFGAAVEVLDPPAARDQLARIGAVLIRTYGSVDAR